jgi:putative transposase
VSRYRWVNARKAEGFDVRAACKVAGVSASAYYDFEARPGPSEAERHEAEVLNEIWDVHHHVDDTYGSPRMTTALRDRGYVVNHKRVERLMADNGIYARDGRRKKLRTTIPDVSAPPLPDLVGRDFAVGEPRLRSCGDITYIPTDEGWLYMASVVDLGSRRLVGFSLGDNMRTGLVSSALQAAAGTRGSLHGLVFHHDRGSQYLSRQFRRLCSRLGVTQSVGRTGSSHDNAVAESFWATMKREVISRYRFASRSQARRVIIAWVRHYNAVRLHSSLGNIPPVNWELRYAQQNLMVA